ncbi:MAG: NAD(P)-dependent glycerol-3-phosphate dehydrogenase [Thiomonas arsenitoxydans]|uniref:Glycerol-3-phosphate dehydrogenase [NAD(P)+] n=1 Tax=Thiomonas arsenitoxydans (strain DSM 22701 / CIP 110005 / 3As) TaxID=426114 RepID=A0A8I1SW88_THIA3|nr:NAD(P)H-dependent glycerol-3-phosphate dehydrogenase [Thiomonas arsenitoxydans]MBN8743346.1 NAD(P)-dependent glycerol-3-phosphate dehydrogenase [Thiomonas arsenitoxydans]
MSSQPPRSLTVLGAGAWGTGIACQIAAHQAVLLWGRDTAQMQRLQAERVNAAYLPDVHLPPAMTVTADLDAALRHAAGPHGLLLLAVPVSGLRAAAQAVRIFNADKPQGARVQQLVWLCKGFEQGSGLLPHAVIDAVFAGMDGPPATGALSGPSFALEVARGLPVALTLASTDAALRQSAVAALHHGAMRIYATPDVVGVEVGGAVKNVLAIATGVSDGMGLGNNARAALITRGLAELSRLGVALGGQADTFMGLSGLGDLVLTATGDLSRNRRVGLALAQGLRLDHIVATLGHVAEGVHTAQTALQLARAHRVSMPITEAVSRLLDGKLTPQAALSGLLQRQPRGE